MAKTLIERDGTDRRWWIVIAALVVLVGVVHATTDFGLAGTAAGAAGLFFLLLGLRSVRQALASRSVERATIGSLGDHTGAVTIEGTAGPADEPLAAPMTGAECVAYRVQVSRYEPTSEGSD